MNAPENIVAFNRVARAIFANLYQSFPTPKRLRVVDLFAEACLAEGSEKHTAGKDNLAASTLRYLVEEGLIRAREESGGQSFTDCVLTVKGFYALGRIPGFIENGESLGEKMLGQDTDRAMSVQVLAILGRSFSDRNSS